MTTNDFYCAMTGEWYYESEESIVSSRKYALLFRSVEEAREWINLHKDSLPSKGGTHIEQVNVIKMISELRNDLRDIKYVLRTDRESVFTSFTKL